MERYVYLQDSDSIQIFKDNMPYKFQVQINHPLTFEGYWKVALTEVCLQRNPKMRAKKTENTLFIYSDVCKESIVKGGEYGLLRRIDSNTKSGWQYIFDSPIYLPLKKTEFQELEVSIKTEDNEFASFLTSPVYLTLHFKRYPFYFNYESV